jgi:DNA-binding NarL/FixJ family response regulator
MNRKRASLLLAEDHVLVGEGIAAALSPYFAIAGSVRSLPDLEPAIERCKPDVVILDISFGTDSSIPIMRRILKTHPPKPAFVMLTAHDSPSLSRAAFGAGALGYVLKGSSVQDLRLAIEAALDGRRFVAGTFNTEPVLPELNCSPRTRVKVGGLQISRRQADIIALLHGGLTQDEVAEHLGITRKGVEYNLSEVRETTGLPRVIDVLRWWEEQWPSASRKQ